jgi:hypothetical protein
MKADKTTVLTGVWMATVAAVIGLAAPAQACGASAENLTLTDDVRAELVQAGATLTGFPASEFTGLRPGRSYYGYDAEGDTYWATATLWGPKSFEAGVMLQDQNSYMLFHKSGDPAATWVPIAAGFGPISAGDEPCPIPESVRDVWQWPTDKCYPPPAAS